MPWYSEACSSTLATTYSSGNQNEKQIVSLTQGWGWGGRIRAAGASCNCTVSWGVTQTVAGCKTISEPLRSIDSLKISPVLQPLIDPSYFLRNLALEEAMHVSKVEAETQVS